LLAPAKYTGQACARAQRIEALKGSVVVGRTRRAKMLEVTGSKESVIMHEGAMEM
jgi:hypothetical protein